MGRLSKNLSGVNQKVFVSPAIEYTDDTTYAAFLANAPEGEIGVFLDSGAVRTTALAAGLKFFIAQKRDGLINKTPIISWDDLKRRLRTAYSAPVKKVQTIGYAGTGSTLDIGLDFTGASATNTLTFGISASETTPGNQPFPVQEGYATVNATTADEYTVLATIVSQLNANYDVQRTQPDRFVKAEIIGNGTLTELTEDATVTNGSRTVTFAGAQTIAAGVILSFGTVPGALYKVTTGVTAGTSLIIDRPYEGDTQTFDVSVETNTAASMAYTSGTTLLGIRLTSLEFETHFVSRGNYSLNQATVTTITEWRLGAGSGTSVRAAEEEGLFFDGVGATRNEAFRDDYGQPTLFSSLTGTYDLSFLDFAPVIFPSAALPIYEQKQIERIYIAAPTGGGATPTNELLTIFGL